METKLVIRLQLIFAILYACSFNGSLGVYSPEMETQIRNETLSYEVYDPVSRPEANTHIKVGLSLIAIDELNLKGQKLTMAGWLTFEWEDHRIHWNKTERDDMPYIFAQPKQIWKPEIIVDNALEDLDIIEGSELLLRVRYDGTIDWEPPRLFVTHCEVDITYYPYDKQKCAVELVSWSYTIEEVQLDHLFEAINLEDFEIHGEWILLKTELEDKNLTEHLPDGTVRIYPQIDFWVYLKRRTEFYNLNVMMPIVLTSLMVVFVFIVPVSTGEKVQYVLTVFLSLAVLLTIVTDTLPPTSITLSILGLYLGMVLIFSSLASLLTILVLMLYHKKGTPDPRSWIVKFAHCAAKSICWKSHRWEAKGNFKRNVVTPMTDTTTLESAEGISDFEDDAIDDKNENLDNGASSLAETEMVCDLTWQEISHIVDRFCLITFFFITIVMNFTFVVLLTIGDIYG